MDQNPYFHYYYYHVIVRKALQFLVMVSIFSFLISYFSGFPVVLTYDQFSSLINSPILNQGLDRKYMFLICNGILAFLSKNLKLGSSGFIMNDIAEDGLKQIPEMQMVMVNEAEIQLNYHNTTSGVHVEDVEEEDEQEEEERKEGDDDDDSDGSGDEAEEIMKNDQTSILESDEDWHINDDYDEDDDDDDEEVISEDVESTSMNDLRVSTEELNKKFEEFIRKMKEEIRIEARQHLIAAV